MTPFQITPGTLIDDRYRVVSRVGSGGMAEVYCADDVQLGRRVAVKLLHERFALDEEFVERFRREASSAASLSHANIVSVYDRGEWGGTYYIAMEYLDGRSLDSIVREEAPLPPDHAIELTEQVLRAARFAHRRGVVHRDLKPHNVIVDEEGRVKVTDFGIAQAGASEITQTGSIMGTARYLSPEQAQGLPVSPRSDLYSIGVMLYELLTGTVPFEGESVVAIALRHLSEPPRPPSSLVPSISPSLDAIVLRALAKSPEERFADADEFLAALDGERARLRNDPTSQTAALAPVVLPAAAFPPGSVAPAHPATYTTQAITPITGAHGHSAAAWWSPANTGQIPPGSVVLPPGSAPARRRRSWPWVVLGLLALAAAAVAVVLLVDHSRHPTTTTPLVPSVVRETKTTALGDLSAAGYVVVIDIIPSHAPVGTVVGQNPARGRGPQGGHDRHAAGLGRPRRGAGADRRRRDARQRGAPAAPGELQGEGHLRAFDDRPQASGDLEHARAREPRAPRVDGGPRRLDGTAGRRRSQPRRGDPGPGDAAPPGGQVRPRHGHQAAFGAAGRDGDRTIAQAGQGAAGVQRGPHRSRRRCPT